MAIMIQGTAARKRFFWKEKQNFLLTFTQRRGDDGRPAARIASGEHYPDAHQCRRHPLHPGVAPARGGHLRPIGDVEMVDPSKQDGVDRCRRRSEADRMESWRPAQNEAVRRVDQQSNLHVVIGHGDGRWQLADAFYAGRCARQEWPVLHAGVDLLDDLAQQSVDGVEIGGLVDRCDLALRGEQAEMGRLRQPDEQHPENNDGDQRFQQGKAGRGAPWAACRTT